MKNLLRIATLVAATTLAARAAAATTPAHAPPGACLLAGGFFRCVEITSRPSTFGLDVNDPPFQGFLISAEAVGSDPFGAGGSGVFISSLSGVFVSPLSRLKGEHKGEHKDGDTRKSEGELSNAKCRDGAKSHADGALAAPICSLPLPADIADLANVVTPEPPGMLLMAMGLLGMAALELWRRSRSS